MRTISPSSTVETGAYTGSLWGEVPSMYLVKLVCLQPNTTLGEQAFEEIKRRNPGSNGTKYDGKFDEYKRKFSQAYERKNVEIIITLED
jgi:hypothetical protein